MGPIKAIKIILILMLPLLIFLSVLNLTSFDESFYTREFSEQKVSENVPDAKSLHQKVMDFLKGGASQPPEGFNEKEKQHLIDVKRLVSISTILLYILLFIFAALLLASAFIIKVNNYLSNFIGRIFLIGGFLTIFLAILLFFLISSDFQSNFESFHTMFFKQGTYTFEAKETIVNLYPEQLFMDLGIRISKWVVITAAVFMLIGSFFIFGSKKNK